jgi:glucokinase
MKTYLGIDIGGTRVKCGVVEEGGRVARFAEAGTPASVDGLRAVLGGLVDEVGRASEGGGVGCKGIIDPLTTEVKVMPGVWGYLEGLRLNTLADGVVAADNDAKAALAGEVAWGAARGVSNALLLTLGTGVGGAVVADGRMLRGAGGVAGHLGHITVEAEGALCLCGNRGCLETVFSARAVEAAAWSLAHQGVKTALTEELRAHPERLTAKLVFERAAEGDAAADSVVAPRVRVLGAAVAGLVHAFDPEIVILTGSMAVARVIGAVREEVAWRVQGLVRRDVTVVGPGVADSSGVVGAAALAWMALR